MREVASEHALVRPHEAQDQRNSLATQNIHVLPQPYVRMPLEEQLQTLQERAAKHFPYAYEEKNFLSAHEDKVKLAQLEERMREMANEEGDKHDIEILDAFLKGRKSREGIILYTKLLGRANVEAPERLKLPVFHYAAFRDIYKEYMRDFILQAEQNSKIQQKINKKLKTMEVMTEKLMEELDNPYELNK